MMSEHSDNIVLKENELIIMLAGMNYESVFCSLKEDKCDSPAFLKILTGMIIDKKLILTEDGRVIINQPYYDIAVSMGEAKRTVQVSAAGRTLPFDYYEGKKKILCVPSENQPGIIRLCEANPEEFARYVTESELLDGMKDNAVSESAAAGFEMTVMKIECFTDKTLTASAQIRYLSSDAIDITVSSAEDGNFTVPFSRETLKNIIMKFTEV